MRLILVSLAFISLMRSSLAATNATDLLCSYGGKQYKHGEKIPHTNGCTEQQCQFGQVIAYWEACGTDIDGECHAVDSSFIYDDITYECQMTVIDGRPIYKNVRLTPVYKDCQVDGNVIPHENHVVLPNTCGVFQCQDGNIQVIDPECGTEVDGYCHKLNKWYKYNEKYYHCVSTTDQNGMTVFENQVLDPQPDPNVRCNHGGVTYNLLDTIPSSNGCNQKQCQNGLMVEYLRMCKFYKDQGKCYSENEVWEFENKRYKCETSVIDGQTIYKAQTHDVSYLSCWLGETHLEHLQTVVVDDGCSLRQCVNGTVPFLLNSCVKDGVCYTIDSIFTVGDLTYKCILTSYGYRKIVKVDDDGTYDEGVKPQPPEIGEIPPYEGCPAIADIILVLDSSRSLSRETYDQEILFATNISNYFKIGPNDVRFGAVVFSDDAQKVFDLEDYGDSDSVSQALRDLPYLQGHTRTDLALNMILDQGMFDTAAGGRDDADDIVIVLTDGNSDDTDTTIAAANRLNAQNIDIITIGVGYISMDELVAMASRYENAFLALSFDVLSTLLNAVSRRACDAVDKCKDDPCEHFCDGTETGFTCSCREGFQVNPTDSTKCDDIDECANTANPPCQQTCENTEGSFKCGCEEGYLVSLIDNTKCYDIDECTSGDVSPCEQDCKNTPGSFECSCEEGFVVDPIDGTKCNDIDECADTANPVCQQTCTNTVGSFECSCEEGYEVDPNDPTQCKDIDECQNGAATCEQICTNLPGSFKCSCEEGFVVNPTDVTKCDKIVKCVTKADIILMFDSSSSIGIEHYDKQFDFAKRLIQHFTVGPDQVRFAGLVFSREVLKLFDLKDHNDDASLTNALTGVKYMNSDTWTHLALQWITWFDMFGTANGGRDDAKDIVILLTDGDANRQSSTVTQAQALKDKDVTIMAIAIGKDITMSKLEQVVSKPDYIVQAIDYDRLDYIEKSIAEKACTEP